MHQSLLGRRPTCTAKTRCPRTHDSTLRLVRHLPIAFAAPRSMAAAPSGAWPQGSALLLCDYQNFIMKGVLGSAEAAAKAAKDAQPVIAAAREAKVPIIYVAVRFREGAPEVSDTNKMFSAYKASGGIAGLYEVRKLLHRHKVPAPAP